MQSPESAVKSFRNLQTAASTLWPADGRLAAPQSNISRTTAERGLLVHVTAFPAGTGVLGFGILTLGTVEEAEALLAEDPGVSGGRLRAEVFGAMTFTADRHRHLLRRG